MAYIELTDPTPTIPQALLAIRAGRPQALARVTRADLIAACRSWGIEIRNGRLQLGASGKVAVADLYFALAYQIGILERPRDVALREEPFTTRGRRCDVCGGQRPPYDEDRGLPKCDQVNHWPDNDPVWNKRMCPDCGSFEGEHHQRGCRRGHFPRNRAPRIVGEVGMW